MRVKSYVEALVGERKNLNLAHKGDDSETEWQLVVNRKTKDKVNRFNSKIFMAKILLDSKAKDIWD